MKKIILLALVLCMCLSLCACGVDEKYEELLGYLENGDAQGAKQELSQLLPELGEEQEKAAADAALLEKYQDLIGHMEAAEYEAAKADVETYIPAPTYSEVAITLDNWQQYFEVRPYAEVDLNENGEVMFRISGEALYLKGSYLSRLDPDKGVYLQFAVSADLVMREYDENTMSFVNGGEEYSSERIRFVATFIDHHQGDVVSEGEKDTSTHIGQVCAVLMEESLREVYQGTRYYRGCYEDWEITGVTGNLLLRDVEEGESAEEPVYSEVPLSIENWQQYFEIRPFERKGYDDIGRLVDHLSGDALYLKQEYLERLKPTGGADEVRFIMDVDITWIQVDPENGGYVENGKTRTEHMETENLLIDHRTIEQHEFSTSTGAGQVFVYLFHRGVLFDNDETYDPRTDSYEIIDVSGSLWLSD